MSVRPMLTGLRRALAAAASLALSFGLLAAFASPSVFAAAEPTVTCEVTPGTTSAEMKIMVTDLGDDAESVWVFLGVWKNAMPDEPEVSPILDEEGVGVGTHYETLPNLESATRYEYLLYVMSDADGELYVSGEFTTQSDVPPEAHELTAEMVTLDAGEFAATGLAIEPVVTVVANGTPLVKDTDYRVVYEDNIKPGTAKAIITGCGNWTGTVEKTFTITQSTGAGRATVTLDPKAAPSTELGVKVKALDGKGIAGDITYRWYVWESGRDRTENDIVSKSKKFTPVSGQYEKWMQIVVFDDFGYLGESDKLWCSKLPVMYIDVDGGATITGDRNNKPEFGADMRLQGNANFTKDDHLYNGRLEIHVRGNTTADSEKKPYKVKLDSKANLLKMGKNKHWVLLSNPYDFSLLRNKIAFDISAQTGLATMESEWVDLIVNGEYVGNYQLCEHIRVDEKRVDIFDWEGEADDVADVIAAANGFAKAETKDLETYLEQHLDWVTSGQFTYKNVQYVLADYNLTSEYDISGGYLFELDRFNDEVTTFYTGTSDGRINCLTKMNRPEYLKTNTKMLDYVKSMWSKYWTAIISPDGYHQGVHYTQLSSLDSMVAYWLTQTFMGQRDYYYSRYAFKDIDNLLVWGPSWDFDASTGGRDYSWKFRSDGTIESRPDVRTGWGPGTAREAADAFYPEWVDDPYFVLKAFEKVSEMKDFLDDLVKQGGTVDEYIDYIFESGVANANMWAGKIIAPGTKYYVSPYMRFDGKDGDAAWFQENLTNRIAWIRSEFRSIRAAVASLKTSNSKNPYTDSASKFTFDFLTAHGARPDSNEGATPDILVGRDTNLRTRVTLNGLTSPATVDVYVNALSNGTYKVVDNAVEFTVESNRFTNVDGKRNMIAIVAKNASGTKLATTYSLVTTADGENIPRDLSTATVAVDIEPEVPAHGRSYEPAVTVTSPEGVILSNGVEYAVEYVDNVLPGTATVRITGLGNASWEGDFPRGNWMGTVERTFVITDNPTEEQLALAQAFGGNARVAAVRDDEWNPTNYLVVVERGFSGPVFIAEDTPDFILDLGGNTIVGTTGALGSKTAAGGVGGPALVVASGVKITVKDTSATPGLIVGGRGGDGNPVGKGGAAVADADGNPVAVLGRTDLVVSGEDGEKIFETTDILSGIGFDTRTDTVRKPATADEILKFAWNNTAEWTAGGNADGAPVSVVVVPVDGTGDNPATWTDAGAARTLHAGAGEGICAWARLENKRYRATLVDASGATRETAYFDLRETELPPDVVGALEEVFGDRATVEALEGGAAKVTLKTDITETVTLPEDLGSVVIDLNGRTMSGPDGESGLTDAAGGDGAPALVVNDGTTLTITDTAATPGRIVGGNGGDGSTAGKGAAAIVDVAGNPVTVQGRTELVQSGADGRQIVLPTVVLVRAAQRYPWNGKIDVDYTVSGDAAAYGLVLTLAAKGTSWTATAANLTGDVTLADGMTAADIRRVTWDADKDCGTDVVDRHATLTLTVKAKSEGGAK